MTNQEYNIHFLATSNCALVLDLLDKVVEDINAHASEGFFTYDQMSGTDVLVMVVVLCHLGDSPMHAEISNTTNPANTLTPCHMCDLSVARMADKKSLEYVSAFVGLSLDGHKRELPKRDWDLTRARTHDIWVTATGQQPSAKRVIEDKRCQFGLRDSVLDGFLAKLWAFNSPEIDGVKELCDHLNRQIGDCMFNPMLRLKVLTFRPVRVHPIKQTATVDVIGPPLIIHISTQNIRYGWFFGENAFGTMGEQTKTSVHLNRQSPGRDIANSFNNYQLMRALLSGSTFFDKDLQARVAAGPRVQDLLHSVPELSQAMGLDPKANQLPAITAGPSRMFTWTATWTARVKEPQETPGFLITEAPHWTWFELASVTLKNQQHVEEGDFVKLAGIWAPDQQPPGKIAILFQETCLGEISPFYGMREIVRINRQRWVNINHNCHRASCPVTNGQRRRVEQRDTEERIGTIGHIATDHYVVNSTSDYLAKKHRQVANIPTQAISPKEWITAFQQGLNTWHTVPVKPRKTRETKTTTGKAKEKEVEMEADDSDWDLEEIMAL
ncbi:hypothetical protein DFH28DRAFT_927167 [Melampsora americana]|nr:hypothetical protein DFH28DRAFT_927167 [Melampsora americana]